MINYILKTVEDLVLVSEEHEVSLEDRALKGYLNELAMKSLSTLDGRLHATKKILGCKAKIPIYINQHTLLMPLMSHRSRRSLYVNYHSIRSVNRLTNGKAIISFFGSHEMNIENSAVLFHQIEKCIALLDYLENEINP